MSTIQQPHVRCKEKTVSDEYRRWAKSVMPQMAALLDQLDAGGTPNFLDIMGAISNLVAFATEGDQIERFMSLTFSEMSGNYCRFCC